jgi:hypothetical protein
MRELTSLAESDRKIALDLLRPHLEDGRTHPFRIEWVGAEM